MTNAEPSFLSTTQQELVQKFLSESPDTEGLSYAMNRSCTAHCVEMIAELSGIKIPELRNIKEYADFVLKAVVSNHDEFSQDSLYLVDDGWNNIAIAELLRTDGIAAVVQDLNYSYEDSDFQTAKDTERAVSDKEQTILRTFAKFGGDKSEKWLDVLTMCRKIQGFPIVSIVIPSSVKPGSYGRHSVLVLNSNVEYVEFVDPDGLLFSRYGSDADEQEIERIDEERLFYRQPADKFLERMTGNVMHISPPSGSS